MAKILIIDDSALSRRMLRKILESESYNVIEAADGFSALEVFSLENPDLVMLDLTMPGINGFDVLKQLKGMKQSIKVLIASADIQSITREMVMNLGADGFVNKPFNPEQILESIQKLISHK